MRTAMFVVSLSALVAAQQNTNWTTFSGDNTGRRHSALAQITPANVARLTPQWLFQTDVPGFPGRGLENSPLIADGIAYLTGNNNQAWAVDARTGRPLWKYTRTLPANFSASVCCGPVNRGFAMLGDRLYMGTLDAHLVALEPIVRRSLTIHTSVPDDLRPFVKVAQRAIARGSIDPARLITHRFPFTQVQQAFETYRDRRDGALKVIVDF